MRRWRRWILAALAALFLLDSARVALWRPRALEGAPPEDGFARVSGVLHVHTRLSDGGGSPEQVIEAARAAGLSFLGLTDHNTLDAKRLEGDRGGLLVLVGTELSTVSGHLLALGIPDPGFRFSGDAADGLADVRDLGGLAFAAHPASPREDLRWLAWDQPGPWGVEVLNADSQFRQASWAGRARTLTTYPLNARYALLSHMGRPDAALARWDALLAKRPTPAVGAADAHGQIELTKKWALPLPSYAASFAVARTHVLLEHPFPTPLKLDPAALLRALGRGRSYVGVDGLAPAGEFSFVAEAGGRRWTMGDTAPATPAPRLRAGGRMPRGTRLVLLRDGRELTRTEGGLDLPAPGPGVYRVEAYVPGWSVPWILTNPIAVFDEPAALERTRAAAWPTPVPAPTPAAVLAAFDQSAAFFDPGADTRSTVEPGLWDATGGVTGGAVRFAFRLGEPDAGHADVFAALVNRAERDLRGRQGLTFALKADGVYRLWVQVRDANPAASDEGTEWWFASVRTSTEWQRVAVPFARLRSIQKGTDGRFDPDTVKALVFLVDKGAMKPGSRGTVWLDDLGVY